MFHGTGHVNELLLALRAVGTAWQSSPNVVEAGWGRHLLEDWKSLRLLVEREDLDGVPSAPGPSVPSDGDAPVQSATE